MGSVRIAGRRRLGRVRIRRYTSIRTMGRTGACSAGRCRMAHAAIRRMGSMNMGMGMGSAGFAGRAALGRATIRRAGFTSTDFAPFGAKSEKVPKLKS